MYKMNGYLELCIGPMFSGKTTHLIQCFKQFQYIGKKICVVNFDQDQRYHDTMLSTHDKNMIPCLQTSRLSLIRENGLQSDVILINEGQFFEDLFDFVMEFVEVHKKTVCIYALDGDFKRNKFGCVLDLIPYCDKVKKLTSLCSICKNGTKAIFSHRLSEEEQQVVIGSDNYIPLCRKCYHEKNK